MQDLREGADEERDQDEEGERLVYPATGRDRVGLGMQQERIRDHGAEQGRRGAGKRAAEPRGEGDGAEQQQEGGGVVERVAGQKREADGHKYGQQREPVT